MQQVKIFKSIENDIWNLEQEINSWIEESGARVVHITGNIAPQTAAAPGMSGGTFSASDVLVIVLYEASDSKSR